MTASKANSGGAVGRQLSRRQFGAASLAALGSLFLLPDSARGDQAQTDGFYFVDGLGREVSVKTPVRAVMPLGVYAQTILTILCPQSLVSTAADVESDKSDYERAGLSELVGLPTTGAYAAASLESLDAGALKDDQPIDLILDVGMPKSGLDEELDALQEESGVPCAFVDVSFGQLSTAYRKLGELLGCSERSERLANFVELAFEELNDILLSSENPPKVFYAPRENGMAVHSGVSSQVRAIEYLGANAITAPYNYEKRTVDMAKLESEKVDYLIFDDENVLEPFSKWEGEIWNLWSSVDAVSLGDYAVSPALMNSWFGSVIHLQPLGLYWLAGILCPGKVRTTLPMKVKEYYSLFYGLELGLDEIKDLIGAVEGLED